MSGGSVKIQSSSKRRSKRVRKTYYLTTRLLNAIVKKAFREASERAMQDMGYVVEIQDGVVVRIDANGLVTKIADNPNSGNYDLKLD